jgi:acetate kinase
MIHDRTTDWGELSLVQARMARADRIAYVLLNGGSVFTQPVTLLTGAVAARLNDCLHLLPYHNQVTQQLAQIGSSSYPHIPQYLLCETAFFAGLPEKAHAYALPYEYLQEGVRRYGGDGLCHEWAWGQASALYPGIHRVVSVHLGDGPSLAAICDGRAVETSCGFTPLDGVPSKTGSGLLDPSLVLELARAGLSPEELDRIITQESGWKALAGRLMNWGDLVTDVDAPASVCREIVAHHVMREIGSCLAALDGAEVITFSMADGGCSIPFLQELCQQLTFTGLRLAPPYEEKGVWHLSQRNSPIQVIVLPYNRLISLANRTRQD